MPKISLPPTTADVDSFTPTQLKRLLALASATSAPLAEPATFEEARRGIAELCRGRKESGPQLLKAVTAPATSIAELRRIKDLAKAFLDDAEEPSHREAARLLYHAAVAATFSRGVDISSRPIEPRMLLYRRFALVFSDSALGQIFRAAVDRAAKAPVAAEEVDLDSRK